MYCPNCGCMTLGKDCEWCGPAKLYEKKPKYCINCGGLKQKKFSEYNLLPSKLSNLRKEA